jgi:tRNA nucleotidyltransferase (CCA-adding enzyme)
VAERFPVDRIPEHTRAIALRLAGAGHEAWFVGGAVRDVLLELRTGRRPLRTGDFDIATSARPEEVQALFHRTVPVGIEHGTVGVLGKAGDLHEVTTFRRDVTTDGRHAVVAFGVSLDDDLARRDFTINAIAVHPVSGELRDPFGGLADLDAGVVRAVGDAAARFSEDRLRVLRALRFAAAFGFRIHEATWEAARAAAGELSHLSRERVRDEWVKMLVTGTPSVGVGLWREAGVLAEVWPELRALPAARDALLDAVDPRDAVAVTAAALFHAGAVASEAEAAALRLRFSTRDAGRIGEAVAGWCDRDVQAGDPRSLRRWLARHRGAWLDVLGGWEPAPERAALREAVEAVFASGAPLSLGDLAVTGDDLAGAGIPPGRRMGEILRALLSEALDEPALNTKERLLARAQELA